MARDQPDPCTRHTLTFVGEWLPRGASRVLEVGAGDGRLAQALGELGHTVVAIDSDQAAVATARALGVDARCARWPDFVDGTFDAIVFTRSLHHLDDLGQCVRHAGAQLRPDGRILVEDFAFADADPATAAWLAGLAGVLRASGALPLTSDDFADRLASATDPHAAWLQDHHDIHPAAAMRAALAASAAIEYEARTPYLFRYLAAADAATVEDVRAAEALAIAAGAIRGIGRRFVAAPYGPGSSAASAKSPST